MAPTLAASRATVPISARIAIVHDWFQGYHGAERAVDAMRSDLFSADAPVDVYTFHAARHLIPADLAGAIVRESRLASLPGLRQEGDGRGRWRFLLPLMPSYFRSLPLDDYDLVLSSSHACALHARPRAGVPHVCYCYTPMRYLWMPETDARFVKALTWSFDRARSRLRRADFEAAQRVDVFVAISHAVRERIRRFYGKDAVVVHPPVDVGDFSASTTKEPGSFLWAHRLVDYKRPELVVEAFRGLPYRLTMVGVGPLEERLRRNLPPNVELLGWVPRERLAELYASSSGFLHVAEEDFGITMVEALASGTPVLALARGGALDIVRDGEDGILLEYADVAAIRRGVEMLARGEWNRVRLAQQAESFSRPRFAENLSAVLRAALEDAPTPAR
jgi:glycosyltransferase involved in cell wall biosynthesis